MLQQFWLTSVLAVAQGTLRRHEVHAQHKVEDIAPAASGGRAALLSFTKLSSGKALTPLSRICLSTLVMSLLERG